MSHGRELGEARQVLGTALLSFTAMTFSEQQPVQRAFWPPCFIGDLWASHGTPLFCPKPIDLSEAKSGWASYFVLGWERPGENAMSLSCIGLRVIESRNPFPLTYKCLNRSLGSWVFVNAGKHGTHGSGPDRERGSQSRR